MDCYLLSQTPDLVLVDVQHSQGSEALVNCGPMQFLHCASNDQLSRPGPGRRSKVRLQHGDNWCGGTELLRENLAPHILAVARH